MAESKYVNLMENKELTSTRALMDTISTFHSKNQFIHWSFFVPEIILANSTDCLGWPSSKTRCMKHFNVLCPGSPISKGRFWRQKYPKTTKIEQASSFKKNRPGNDTLPVCPGNVSAEVLHH